MMSANAQQIRAIHAEARRIGMDEDMRRSFMLREVGQQSSKDMTEAEAQKVILAMKRLPGNRTAKRPRSASVSGKYGKKLQAMWLSAYHLGVIKNADDRALIKFAKRQTGVDHTQFLTHGSDAAKVIDAIKTMMVRAGLDLNPSSYPARDGMTELAFLQVRIIAAQRRKLGLDAHFTTNGDLNAEIARLGVLVREKQKAAA